MASRECSWILAVLATALGWMACGGDAPCPAGSRASGDRCIVIDSGSGHDIDSGSGHDAGACETTYYADTDGDGAGDPSVTTLGCLPPPGHVAVSGDCDDSDPSVRPGASERCSGADEDCDDLIDEDFTCTLGAAVECSTSCGSTGSGTCTASCALPAGSDCTPPAETCNDQDDDCDGLVDDGLLSLDLRSTFDTANAAIELVATASGYLVFYAQSQTLLAHRLDAAGAPVGAPLTLATGINPKWIDASRVGPNTVVAWMKEPSIWAAVLSDELAVTTAAKAVGGVSDFGRGVAVVASGPSALFISTDGLDMSAFVRAFPALSGLVRTTVRPSVGALDDFAATLDPTRNEAIVAYVTSTNDIELVRVTMSGVAAPSVLAASSSTLAFSRPTLQYVEEGGQRTLGLAYDEATSPTSHTVKLALFSVNTSGGFALRETTAPLLGLPPTAIARPVALTRGGGRWVVSALSTTSPFWRYAEVFELPSSVPLIERVAIETTTSANTGVALAPGPGASVLFAASRTDGFGRTYLLGCP